MGQLVCEKCGAELVAGSNWYTSKGDHICCDCSGWPHYYAPPIREPLPTPHDDDDANAYIDAILARQESWYND